MSQTEHINTPEEFYNEYLAPLTSQERAFRRELIVTVIATETYSQEDTDWRRALVAHIDHEAKAAAYLAHPEFFN
jgi:hypothetical protein